MIDEDDNDIKTKENSQDEETALLQYFFIIGLDIHSMQEIQSKTPRIISSYSSEGDSEEFLILSSLFNTDKNLLYNVFPCKTDYLETYNYESEEIVEKHVLTDYYLVSEHKPIYHSFLYKYWSSQYYDWYFNCFIFWEPVSNLSITVKKQPVKQYIAKAMILITKEPYFTLCKEILMHIYMVFNRKDSIQNGMDPIEPFIIDLFKRVRRSNGEELNITISTMKKYHLSSNKFLPVCDLNLSFFFKYYFNLTDVLFLTEHFLKRKSIVIITPNIEICFPIYHILMTLIYPLNITDNTYLYRLLTPTYLNYVTGFQSFLFIYANPPTVPSAFLEKMCSSNEDILVIQFLQNTTKDIIKYIITRTNEGIIEIQNFDYTKLIIYNLLTETKSDIYFDLILGEIKKLKEEKEESLFTSGNHDEIRRLFFGLINRFLFLLIPKVTFEIKAEKIVIDCKNHDNITSKYKEFLHYFLSTPSYDFIIKERIKDLQCPNLKDLILLDELYKIIQIDPTRVYYELKAYENTRNSVDIKDIPNDISIDYYSYKNNPQLHYINEYNKYSLRHKTNFSFIHNPTTHQIKVYYHSIALHFDLFKQSHELSKKIHIPQSNILLMEFETFADLLNSQTIPINSNMQIVTATISLCLSIIIFNNPIKEKDDNNLIILLFLFNASLGFYQRFNVLLSLLYELIDSDKTLRKIFMMDYFEKLNQYDLLPTFNMYLKYNHKENALLNQKTYPKSIRFNFGIMSQEIINFDNTCHSGEEKCLDNNFVCSKCYSPFLFKTITSDYEEIEDMLIHPRIIMMRMVSNIIKNKGVIVENINYFYKEWKNDLCQIAFLMKVFFNMKIFECDK